MINDEENTPREIGPFRRAILSLAGVDQQLIKIAPARDENTIIAKVLLLFFSTILLAAEFGLVAHLAFTDGGIDYRLVAASVFLSTLIASLDCYLFLRGSFLPSGTAELRRAGLEFGSPADNKARKVASIAVRLILSVGIAFLCSIGISLLIYSPEVASELDRISAAENAPIIGRAEKQADDKIARLTASTKQEEDHVVALRNQTVALRESSVNPASDPSVGTEQEKVAQLLTIKQQRDGELVAAQTRAADELAGIKSNQSSGVPGRGPMRQAAEELVKQAQAASDNADKALTDEQARLDEMRSRLAATSGDRSRQAQAQLPALEADLETENERLEAMRAELNQTIAHREADVRAAVENAPDHIRRNKGILTQLHALADIASRNPEAAATILLIDILAMALEGSFVIATSVAYIPTTYSALVARDHIVRLMRLVQEVGDDLTLSGGGTLLGTEMIVKGVQVFVEVANDNALGGLVNKNDNLDGSAAEFGQDDGPPDPPRRGRGRPPKSSIN